MDSNAQNITRFPADLTAVKAKQRDAWSAGDYARIGVTLQWTGEILAEAMDLAAGQTVLDVAAGNGNATLAAARRFCKVVSSDYVEHLLKQSEKRAIADGLPVEYRIADAEHLPFADHQFDNVISTFGVMFTPNADRAAAELIRVCRPGGRIGLSNWTPDGFIGRLFRIISGYIAPPPGVASPTLWGTHKFLDARFGHCAAVEVKKHAFCFRFQSPRHWLDLFRKYYGPLNKAFDALDTEKCESLETDILELIAAHNTSVDGTMRVPSEYLQVVITR